TGGVGHVVVGDFVDRRRLGRDRDARIYPPGPVVVVAAGEDFEDADLDDAVQLGIDAGCLQVEHGERPVERDVLQHGVPPALGSGLTAWVLPWGGGFPPISALVGTGLSRWLAP